MSESNINVAVKMRPLIKRELEKRIPVCWKVDKRTLIDSSKQYEFPFDLIFDENSTTTELYDKVARPIVSNALAGVNGTVFAYGQTSSGKTHTMMGNENNDGLMLMAIKHIFTEVQSSNIEFVLRVGFIEIYNEKIFDLYDPDNVDLKMVEKNNDAYVNCKEAICKCVDDMHNVIKIGNKNKKIGDTDMNDRSSRSHTIFRIAIESIDQVSEKAKISNLNLVDLAGSERASQTNSSGARFVEGAHINKSLLSLSKVINKLINNESCHINYRDSKLTRYLQSSLGGNALAAIICTICPTALDETISTLYFAQRAMKVTNKPIVNEIISDATMIKQLHNQIKVLKGQLEKAKNETNSAVPRLLQELSYHQGNILNYRKAESKAALRRRTWNTFDCELAIISEVTPLVLDHKLSLSSLNTDAVAPVFPMVTADRGTGEMYDAIKDHEEMVDEFEYKSKYQKLLLDYEELQEFTDWEKKLGVEPDGEDAFRVNIDLLEKDKKALQMQLTRAEQEKSSVEYLYEQHQKKAEQREKDLVSMLEELKTMDVTVDGSEEQKSQTIKELQDQIRYLSDGNAALSVQVSKHGDVEQRLAKMAQVEVELEELKNTITVLTNTVLTLEIEKKEMSMRFNESITGLCIDQSPVPMMVQSSQTEEMVVVIDSKLQADYDELSNKVMDLIEENEELKLKSKDLEEKFVEMEQLQSSSVEAQLERDALVERVAVQLSEIEALSSERNQLSDNFETKAEEVDMLRSDKEWLERKMQEADTKLQDTESQLREAMNKLQDMEMGNQEELSDLRETAAKVSSLEKELEEKHQVWQELVKSREEDISVLKEEATRYSLQLEISLKEMKELAKAKEEELSVLKEKAATISSLQIQSEEMQQELQELKKTKQDLEEDINSVTADRDGLIKEVAAAGSKLAAVTAEKEELAVELEKSVQQLSVSHVERDCLANDLRNQLELISEMEKNVESGHSELKKDLMEAQMEKARLATEAQNKDVELEQLRHDHEESLRKLADQAKTFQETEKDLEHHIEKLRDELKFKEDDLQRKLSDQLQLFEQTKADLQQNIEKLSLDMQVQMQENNSKLSQQSGVFEESKAALELKIEKLSNSLRVKCDELESVELELKTLSESTKDVEMFGEERERLNSELELQLQKVHSLTTEMSTLRLTMAEMESVHEKERATATVEDLRQELMLKSKKIAELEEQLESVACVERDLDVEKESRVALQSQLEEQMQKLHVLSKEKNEMKCEVESLQDQLAETQEELVQLREHAEAAAKEYRARESLSNSWQDKVTQLEREVLLCQEEIRSKDLQIDEFLNQMRQLESHIDEKINDLTTARKAVDVMATKMKALEESMQESGNQKECLVESLKAEKEKLLEEVSALVTEQRHAEERYNKLAGQLREAEEAKLQLANSYRTADAENRHIKGRLEAAANKRAELEERSLDLKQKHEIIRSRVAELEVELKRKEQQLVELTARTNPIEPSDQQRSHRAHEEEVSKLQGQIKKLRNDLAGFQNKERKARRSSTFDTNRDLFSDRSVGTMTDPTSETCQCQALSEKINELKRNNLIKDLQMVELKEAEKRSPMLLENYNLKRMVQQFKEKVATQAKEIEKAEHRLYQAMKASGPCKACEAVANKKVYSVQSQTMPDLNLEKIADLKRELQARQLRLEDTNRISAAQLEQIHDLENIVASRENNRNEENVPGQMTLQDKYNLVKAVVEKRYHTIVNLETQLAALTARRTCVKCKGRMPTLQP